MLFSAVAAGSLNKRNTNNRFLPKLPCRINSDERFQVYNSYSQGKNPDIPTNKIYCTQKKSMLLNETPTRFHFGISYAMFTPFT
mmetsp:Transcript_2318/g.2669  ORF Transcript_2318/g.2669 Transcript_2318/m.2669 type:complete len:84 (-) Transcript_2318:367-618(-)